MSDFSTKSYSLTSSTTNGLDLTLAYMASRAETSTRTYESPDESSTGPTPIVEEPSEILPNQPRQDAKSEQYLEAILREFVSRFISSLRDWYQALREYRQLQLVRSQSTSHAMGILFREFFGDPDQYYKQARHEYFDMRCYSLKRKDVEFHYKRMSGRYHILGGINDQSLKHVIPLILIATSASSSATSSSSPIMDYPPELLSQIPSGQQPSLQQLQDFTRSYLPIYLSEVKQQGCRHSLSNSSKPYLDSFLMPPIYYFSPQVLWFLLCLSILYHHAIVFPLQATYAIIHASSHDSSLFLTFLQWFSPLSTWNSELTKLIGQYNLWKLDTDSAASSPASGFYTGLTDTTLISDLFGLPTSVMSGTPHITTIPPTLGIYSLKAISILFRLWVPFVGEKLLRD
ncbi:hypothetical protein Dsin_021964 [Dipteronia sinensis]|uniref:Uncharacterized protein n=1 Tax=Dipteronia sinensis TaxID=43782 RepID=A0AAE0DZM1_9ROSI|nr:hypothetical protein Dsin_021964 [Dipteronia sinensis]